jgi:hypothetical protein
MDPPIEKTFEVFSTVDSKLISVPLISYGPAGNRTRDSSVQAKCFTTRLQAHFWYLQSACTSIYFFLKKKIN